ncbi:calmodulin-like protein 6 [Pteronotus mesoamericanus]|uniref:calmodulin-like protein 6 n=1 Tax=Pteronotus mesoamericanus TaxID=1884717 RepID=UPI0023EE0847|nr:calmodulin-like protein 6 [Pteronotus parnellii mesoamericanus]
MRLWDRPAPLQRTAGVCAEELLGDRGDFAQPGLAPSQRAPGCRWQEPFVATSAPGEHTESLVAAQATKYKGVFEMFNEEGNREVTMGELERLVSRLGTNPTESQLTSMAKAVDRDTPCKAFFNCDSFLAPTGIPWEKARNQEGELRVALRVFDQEGKGCLHRDTLESVLMNAGEPLSEVDTGQLMEEAMRTTTRVSRGRAPGAHSPGRPGCCHALCFPSSWP